MIYDYVSLFWYWLNKEENITEYSIADVQKKTVMALRNTSKTKVMGLIANDPDYTEEGSPSWDSERVKKVIGTESARQKHVEGVIALLESMGFDGIDIDYENLKSEQRESFTQFIELLANALHTRNKLLGVAIHPKTREGDPNGSPGSDAQDWPALSKIADRLYLTLFGEHGPSWSPPGPSAPIEWFERVLDYAVETIPKEKIVPEVYFGAEGWKKTGENTYEESDVAIPGFPLMHAQKIRDWYEAVVQWDDQSQTPYFEFKKDNLPHSVWFENARSIRTKIEAITRREIPNLAYWHMGGETPEINALLDEWRTGRASQ